MTGHSHDMTIGMSILGGVIVFLMIEKAMRIYKVSDWLITLNILLILNKWLINIYWLIYYIQITDWLTN